MATSIVPSLVPWLIDTFKAASTLGAASPPVTICCGPELTAIGTRTQLILWVAIDEPYGLLTGSTPTGADTQQTWVGFPAGARDETASIFCVAEAWAGSTDTRAAMLAAYGITAAVEDILRVNKQAGDATGRRWPLQGFSEAGLRWHQGDGGAAAQVHFRLDYKARIGASPGL